MPILVRPTVLQGQLFREILLFWLLPLKPEEGAGRDTLLEPRTWHTLNTHPFPVLGRNENPLPASLTPMKDLLFTDKSVVRSPQYSPTENISWDFPGGLVVQSLLCNARDLSLIPVWGTGIMHAVGNLSCMPQWKIPNNATKIWHARAKTQHSQININKIWCFFFFKKENSQLQLPILGQVQLRPAYQVFSLELLQQSPLLVPFWPVEQCLLMQDFRASFWWEDLKSPLLLPFLNQHLAATIRGSSFWC